MVRLIATDLDGTLLQRDGTMPEGAFEAIESLSAVGIRFAAASGRQLGNLKRLFAPVADKMDFVCENGAICAPNGQVTDVIPMPQELALEVIDDIEQAGMNLLISGRHTCYVLNQNRTYTDDIIYRLRNTVTVVECLEQITEPMLKISGQIDEGLEAIAPHFLKKWASRLTATVSGHDWFDFTAANKGMGLQVLMNKLGLEKEEVAAFGDNFNDESMLDSVGYPFLMEKADPRLRKSAYLLCRKEVPVLRAIALAEGRMEKALNRLSE